MSKIKYKACIYARLSKDDGDDAKKESNSISNQKALVRDFLSNYPEIEIVAEKVDDGYSGVSFDRPAFNEMMEMIRSRQVNCVVCKDLSRFGRNYIEAGNYIEKVFPFLGVRFIAINDGYDSAEKQNQSSNLVIPFKNLINDAYCKDISVKIRSQLEIKRKKGEFLSAFAVYGYQKDPEDHNKLIPDLYAAEVVKQIFHWKLEGMSQGKIASELNKKGVLCPMEYKLANGENIQTAFRGSDKAKWSSNTVKRILQNEVYIGVLVQGKQTTPNHKLKNRVTKDESEWVRIENAHEAIIDHDTFMAVKDLMNRDIRTSPEEETVYLFSGFIRCGDCGQNMVRKTIPAGKKKYTYYVCSTNKSGKGCSSHSISEAELSDTVLRAVRAQIALIADIDRLYRFIDDLPENQRNIFNYDAQIIKLQEEIEKYKKFKMKLYENLEEGIINQQEYFQYKNNYTAKINDAEETIESLKKERQEAVEGNHRDNVWISVFRRYENISELDRRVVVELIESIEVFEGNRIQVNFKYKDECRRAIEYIEKLSHQVVMPKPVKGGVPLWQGKVERRPVLLYA